MSTGMASCRTADDFFNAESIINRGAHLSRAEQFPQKFSAGRAALVSPVLMEKRLESGSRGGLPEKRKVSLEDSMTTELLDRSTSHGTPLNRRHPPRQIQSASDKDDMSNNDLTHKGDGSSQPDTDHNSSMNPNPETSRRPCRRPRSGKTRGRTQRAARAEAFRSPSAGES